MLFRSDFDGAIPQRLDFIDGLIMQLDEQDFTDWERSIAEEILWNLDDRGYLAIEPVLIGDRYDCEEEEVLRILKNTQKSKKLVIASMGTDGIDGNSVFAGAITENVKVDLDTMKEFLKNSDSGRFFQKQKGSIVTDFTHTNLMDIGVILR